MQRRRNRARVRFPPPNASPRTAMYVALPYCLFGAVCQAKTLFAVNQAQKFEESSSRADHRDGLRILKLLREQPLQREAQRESLRREFVSGRQFRNRPAWPCSLLALAQSSRSAGRATPGRPSRRRRHGSRGCRAARPDPGPGGEAHRGEDEPAKTCEKIHWNTSGAAAFLSLFQS